jgi:expansin (peptidoglycan-binding protein)
VTGDAGRRRRRARSGRRAPLWLVATAGAACIAVLIFAVTAGRGASCTAPAAVPAADVSTTGEATDYTLASGTIGNCSLYAPPDDLYVALPPSQYADGTQCGSYLQVKGPSGTVRVKVVDQCPECATGHIDLSRTAFADIGVLSQGIIPVTFSTVVDPQLPGPMTVQVKPGSSQYWLSVVVDNTGNPLAQIQASSAGGSRQELTRTSYDFWVAQAGLGPGPFAITVTDDVGHTAEFGGVVLEPGVVQTTSTWMYGAGPAPAATTETTPATPTFTAAAATAATTIPATTVGMPSPALPPVASSAAGPSNAAARC